MAPVKRSSTLQVERRKSPRLMKNEYRRKTEELLDWVRESRTWLESDRSGNSLQEVRRKLQWYRDYRAGEGKTREEQKSNLETFLTIKEDIQPRQEVKKAWTGLLIAEQMFEEEVEEDLRRLERLERLAREFRQKAELVDVWTRDKKEMLQQEDFRQLKPAGLRERIKEVKVLEFQLTRQQLSLEYLAALGQKLQDWNYSDSGLVRSRTGKLRDQLERLNRLSQQRAERLEEELRGREEGVAVSRTGDSLEDWLMSQTETMDLMEKMKTGSEEEEVVFQFRPPPGELEEIFSSGYTQHGVERLRAGWEGIKRIFTEDNQVVTKDYTSFTQDQRQEFQYSLRKVMTNEVIMEKVFSYLDPTSVRKVRLVSRMWKFSIEKKKFWGWPEDRR